MLFYKMPKGYCRNCGSKCSKFKLNRKNPHISKCKSANRIISKTTPLGDAVIKAPPWCPKRKK